MGTVSAQSMVINNDGEARLSPRLLNYQGYLTDTIDIPVDGTFEMTFYIYDAASGGSDKWKETHNGVIVERGVFSVILGQMVAVPDSAFTGGTDRWLEIVVDGQTLSPRTRITSVSYAYTATYADTADYTRNGDNDWVRSTPDSVLFTANYLGIARGSAANILFGDSVQSHVNFGYACTTGVDGVHNRFTTIGGGRANKAAGSYSTVAGGYRNTANNTYVSIGGGYDNTADDVYATVAGGRENVAAQSYSAVAGGYYNDADGEYSFIGGGYVNAVSNNYNVIGGGNQNNTTGYYSIVGTGYADTVQGHHGFCGTGYRNIVGDAVGDSAAVVVSGRQNSSTGKFSFIGTGRNNTADGDFSVITGGSTNTASGYYASICGGFDNSVLSNCGTVGGGSENVVNAVYSFVAGGYADTVGGDYSFLGSGISNRAGNDTNDSCAVVVGGYDCAADSKYCFIGTGESNEALHPYSVCVGGESNIANNSFSFIGCGYSNNIYDNGVYSSITGGYNNTIRSWRSFIGGGDNNVISSNAYYGTIAGGVENYIGGTAQYATIPGGVGDTVYGDWYSLAANAGSYVPSTCDNSAAFNGRTSTTINQVACGTISKIAGSFTIDHPLDPLNKILNHYFVESPEMINVYRGVAVLDTNGYAEIVLPDYFDALNRTPMVQLTGVGTSDVYVADKVQGNRFAIGGKPGTEVYWTVTGDRKDPGAEIARVFMPVEQEKVGELKGRSLDDDFYAVSKSELMRLGKDHGFEFRTARGQVKYEKLEELKRKAISN
jgi:hypothetical protein